MDPASHPQHTSQQSPGDQYNRFWWVAPLVLTLLAVPGSFVLLFFVGIGQMAFDPCQPGGCPRTEQHYAITVAIAASSLIPVVGVWVFPHRRKYTGARLFAILAYVLLFVLTIAMLMAIPVGE